MPADPPLGVYVHWPYCARICPYCDFNVARHREVNATRWRTAFLRDLRFWRERAGPRPLASLYFGGGTPSLAPPQLIESVIAGCAELWGLEPNAEITLEANPSDAEQLRFADFRTGGVNRLSLGVQSFDDRDLRFLRRNHGAAEARAALALALKTFPRVSFDLIYALPEESPEAWRRRLAEALEIGAPHLSLYQLTIEAGVPFARAARRGLFAPASEARAADLFDIAQEETARAGLPAYEISNHARRGEESRHNLLYWTGGDYVGVGPGAHGRITVGAKRFASETVLNPEDYLAAVETTGTGAASIAALDAEAELTEKISAGLRLSRGVMLAAADRAQLAGRAERVDALARDGFLAVDGCRIRATPAGRRVLDAVLSTLLAA
jgi:oxygen-independent coproporphyrinogen-3 oxidase